MLDLLFENLKKYNISPNAFYALYCTRYSEEPVNINIHLETRVLQKEGFLDRDNKFTEKSISILREFSKYRSKENIKKNITPIDLQFIEKYNELFPDVKLPSNKYAKSNLKNLETNFKWFFSVHKYSWETILQATEMYVEEFEKKNYMFMRTSMYFIRKQEPDKSFTSDLANYCELVERGYTPPEELSNFSIKVFKNE